MLEVDGQTYDALIKEIDFDTLKGQLLEIDFQALVSNEKVHSVAEIILLNHEAVQGRRDPADAAGSFLQSSARRINR